MITEVLEKQLHYGKIKDGNSIHTRRLDVTSGLSTIYCLRRGFSLNSLCPIFKKYDTCFVGYFNMKIPNNYL